MSRNLIVITLLLGLLHPTASFADRPTSEVTTERDASVSSKSRLNKKNTVLKANKTSVLRLAPLSRPPANPSAGDIYFSTNDELFIYAKGKWTPIFSAAAHHGAQHITSGTGTWTVPEGVYSLRVTMTGGGGGGSARFHREPGEDNSKCLPGGVGGNGGVQLHAHMDVVPGRPISYSVGSGGSAGRTDCTIDWGMICNTIESGSGGSTLFGSLSASGGQGGSRKASGPDGSPSGTYPYGSYGQGGSGLFCSNNAAKGAPGDSGAIYIQY